MDPIKNLYIHILTIISIILIICFADSVRKRSRISFAIAGLTSSSLFSILFHISAILIRNKDSALLMYLFYYSMLDISAVAMLFLVYVLEERRVFSKRNAVSSSIFIAICIVDVFLMFFIGSRKFEITPFFRKDLFYSWLVNYYKPYFNFHETACRILFLFLGIKLTVDSVKTVKGYKLKYVVVLLLMLLVLALNSFYITHPWYWKIDFSMVVYGITCIQVYLLVIHVVPKRAKNNMLSIANETISDAVICFDNREVCIYYNKIASEIYKGPKTEWIQDYIYNPEDFIRETLVLKVGDEDKIFDLEFRRVRDYKDRYSGSYFKLNDRTAEIKKIEQEEYRASHDELTSLFNRNYFFAEMEKILHAQPDVPRVLVCTDIKNFKLVNDIFGPELGDLILTKQAEMLSRAQRPGVVIGRISGDRFAMLIEKKNFNPELALKNTEAINDISKRVKFPLKVYIGVYEVANSFENVHTMYDKANLAIKNNEDNQSQIISYYDTSLMNKLIHEKNIIGEFKYAIQSNQFFMFLQPQIDVKTEKCVGAEALVRWYDIDKGYRSPSEFIHILEKSGLIYRLDYYIWEKAVQTVSKWQAAGDTDFSISVNISTKDFYFANLYKVFTSLVEKYKVSPKYINLEITESVLIDNKKLHKSILSELQAYGFKVEMDDFGSGYSSLNVLKEISMDVLKIDMEFLHESSDSIRGKQIIHSVVNMAHKLGMEVICEGVETQEQKQYLSEFGVDLFQGYYFSKPISLQDFEHTYLEGKK